MSPDNVEVLRTFWQSWSAGDVPDMSRLDPEFTYEDTTLPDHVGETYRGPEGLARALERWLEPWEEVRIELEQIAGTGDRLVSIHRFRAKARHTRIEFDEPLAYLWVLRDGRVIHLRSFRDPAEALEAMGRPE